MAQPKIPTGEQQNGLAGALPTGSLSASLIPIASEQSIVEVPPGLPSGLVPKIPGSQATTVGQKQEAGMRSNISRELSKLGF